MATKVPVQSVMTVEEKTELIKAMKESFKDDLVITKTGMITNSKIKFVVSTICNVEPELVADLEMPTAAANGKRIMVDPEFWKGLTTKQRIRLIFHEGFHNMFGHCDKRITSETDRMAWNIAADCIVESYGNLCDAGEPIEGGISPNSYGNVELKINNKKLIIAECHNKTVEIIYDILMQHAEKNPPPAGGKGNGPGGGYWLDANGKPLNTLDNHQLGEATQDERNEREQNLRQALVEHKLKGTMPGGLADMIEEMLKGRVNWRAEIRDMVTPEIKSYTSFKRRNRRALGFDVMLPGSVKEGLNIVASIDTSGSIGKKEIEYYAGELANIFGQFDEDMVHATVLLHHSHVYAKYDIDSINDLKKLQTESGGTSHVGVFEAAEDEEARVLICFTDGYSSFPESTTIGRVLWIVTEERGMNQIPDNLGKKILVELKDLQED